jgi:undecaprenyl-diphosphatase
MEDLLKVIVLGIVQGLTEFLPISSSGHLILVRELFGWEFEDDLAIDLALHLGTTAALLGFFWREWAAMLSSAARWRPGQPILQDEEYGLRLLLLLGIGTVPALVVGFLLGDIIEDELRSAAVVGVTIIVFAFLLFVADRWSAGPRAVTNATWGDALTVGFAQTLALVPGVSRSGITITASLFRRFSRQAAARFSFLLATPVTLAASVYALGEAAIEGIPRDEVGLMVVGAVVSGIVGWLAIRFLLAMLRTSSYLPFVIYRIVVGVFVIAYFAL